MATNTLTMRYNLAQNRNDKSKVFGKYFAEVDRRATLTTRGLAKHMRDHECPYSEATIRGVLGAMTECIPELVAQGYPVKLDGLGTFHPTLENKPGGADSIEAFNQSLIEGVHVRFTPDGAKLDNITSKVFRDRVSLEEGYLITRTGSKLTNDYRRVLTPLSDARLAENQGSGAGGNGSGSGSGDDDQPIVNP